MVVLTLATADFVFHLAGVNWPQDPAEFATGNAGLTQSVCNALAASGRRVPLVLTSSTQAALDNAYGRSKGTGSVQFIIQVIDLKHHKSHGNKVASSWKDHAIEGDGGQILHSLVTITLLNSSKLLKTNS